MPVENMWKKAGRKERIKRVGTGIPSFFVWIKSVRKGRINLTVSRVGEIVRGGSYEPQKPEKKWEKAEEKGRKKSRKYHDIVLTNNKVVAE